MIYIDSLIGKKLFLDFWKLSYSLDKNLEADVSVVNGEGFETSPGNAIVLLRHEGKPELYRFENGIHIFARVRSIREYPSNLQVVTRIFDKNDNVVSFILRNRLKNTVYLPFFLDEPIESFYYEKYISGRKTSLAKPVLNLYYRAKALIPTFLKLKARSYLAKRQKKIQFPRWPLETSLEDFKRFVLELLLSVAKTRSLPFIWVWPREKEFCLLLTHDIESGLSNNGGIFRLISAEQEAGFRSSCNVVPFKYPIENGTIQKVKSLGCEIGVHGYSHDAKLFSSWQTFRERVPKINAVAKKWGAVGFRSASTYRNPFWLNLMQFDYDSSFFDTDPFEPQPGGCLSLFPYVIDEIVELPITMPQDHTLFSLLGEKDARVWIKKAAEIRKRNGLICLVAHPDKGYVGDKDKIGHYVEFLKSVAEFDGLWNPWPSEVAEWWRKRNRAAVVAENGTYQIKGGTPEMSIKWATLADGELRFEDTP